MKFPIVLAMLSATLTPASALLTTRSDDSLPATFYLQAIELGAPTGSYILFLYNGYPHDYGTIGNVSDYAGAPTEFSFNAEFNRLRLSYQPSQSGVYESEAPVDTRSLIFEPYVSEPSGQLAVADDGAGGTYITDSTYTGANALNPWALCQIPQSTTTRLDYAPDALPLYEENCKRVALKVETI